MLPAQTGMSVLPSPECGSAGGQPPGSGAVAGSPAAIVPPLFSGPEVTAHSLALCSFLARAALCSLLLPWAGGGGLPPCPQLLPGSLLPRRLCPENVLPWDAAGLHARPSGCFCPFEAPCLEEEGSPASKSGSQALGREGRPSLCLPPPGQVLLVEEGPRGLRALREAEGGRSSGEGAGLYVKTECHSAPEETASTAPRVPQRLEVEWLSARRGGSGSAQAPWSGLALPF